MEQGRSAIVAMLEAGYVLILAAIILVLAASPRLRPVAAVA